MHEFHVTMAPNGRLVVPSALRAALKMERGGALVARLEDGTVKLEPLANVNMCRPAAISRRN
jgi:bifunctional DNA-binding transcriptional regulator/antitoxin component of YhaV-PrlF toxin-antitoxin module